MHGTIIMDLACKDIEDEKERGMAESFMSVSLNTGIFVGCMIASALTFVLPDT